MERNYDDGRELTIDKPEFMRASDALFTELVSGRDGSNWFLFRKNYSWAVRPCSARLLMRDDVLEISIRLRWEDDETAVPSGEVEVRSVTELEDVFDVSKYMPLVPHETFAVPLPHTIQSFAIK